MTDETAKAAKEVAKATSKGFDLLRDFGSFLSKSLPADLIGIAGGDWLHHARIRNHDKIARKTLEILRSRGVEPEEPSPSIATPLIEAAQDESREELQDLWARLIASAMDPSRSGVVRREIIHTVKQMEPLDARVLELTLRTKPLAKERAQWKRTKNFPRLLDVSIDELELSIQSLRRLDCVTCGSKAEVGENREELTQDIKLTTLGREVLRACY